MNRLIGRLTSPVRDPIGKKAPKCTDLATNPPRFLILSLVGCFLLASYTSAASSSVHTPKTLMRKSEQELQTILAALDHKLTNLDQEKASHQEETLVKAMARDMIDHAYRERNQTLQQKELTMGLQLIKNPKAQMDLLRKESKTKEEALWLLEKALKDDDPDRQEVLIHKAEKMVYWLETGKELKKKPAKIPKIPSTPKLAASRPNKAIIPNSKPKKVTPASNGKAKGKPQTRPKAPKVDQSVKERADEIALQLVVSSRNETDSELKQEMLRDAFKLQTEPQKHLKPYLIRERKKAIIREESTKLMGEIPKLDAEWKREAVLKRLDEFYKYPLREMKKIRDAEKAHFFDEATKMALKLLHQAKSDTNPETQEIKIRAAKKLIMYPITAMRRMANKLKTDKFLHSVPDKCRSSAAGVFAQGLSNILVPDFNRIDDKVRARIELYSRGEDWKNAPAQIRPMPNPNILQSLAAVPQTAIRYTGLSQASLEQSLGRSLSSMDLAQESAARLSLDQDSLEDEAPTLVV